MFTFKLLDLSAWRFRCYKSFIERGTKFLIRPPSVCCLYAELVALCKLWCFGPLSMYFVSLVDGLSQEINIFIDSSIKHFNYCISDIKQFNENQCH
jgi:hypothetical protein